MLWETLAGAITGLIGNGLTAWTNYKTQKLKNEQDAKMYDFKLREIEARTNAVIRTTEAKVTAEIEVADSDVYKESQVQGNKDKFSSSWISKLLDVEGRSRYVTIPIALFLITLLGMVDVLKGFMRPGLTLYLTIITSWLTYKAYDILRAAGPLLNSEQAFNLYNETTSIVIYLTVSCITWWFGDRRSAKFLMQMKSQPGIHESSNLIIHNNMAVEEEKIAAPSVINKPSEEKNLIPK